jgi:hypothetical protein
VVRRQITRDMTGFKAACMILRTSWADTMSGEAGQVSMHGSHENPQCRSDAYRGARQSSGHEARRERESIWTASRGSLAAQSHAGIRSN